MFTSTFITSFMMRFAARCITSCCVILGVTHSVQAAVEPWVLLDQMPQAVQNDAPWVRPPLFKAAQLDTDLLRQQLAPVPLEVFPIPDNEGVYFEIPHPRGGMAAFRIVESPIMEAPLAAQFPDVKTYRGQGIDDPAANIRFDLTPQGFHAMVLSPDGDYFIDPYSKGDVNHYAIYYKRDNIRTKFNRFFCGTTETADQPADNPTGGYGQRASGATLRNYRLAVAATVEFTAFHGGTVAAGQAAIVTAINRVTGLYERDLCVRLTLVANNSNIVYATSDNYTNGDGGAMLGENQANITAVIGSANYDIGHVFSTGGGGVAGLGVVCNSSTKARGVSGSPSPTGDSFWVDYVAHEMGHQFNGSHSFNGTVGSCGFQRSATAAFEPGSGSTIMSYAGICGADDLQPNSDAAFHSTSYAAMRAFVLSGGGSACGTNIATGNAVPTVSGGTDFTIPFGTAFTLSTASAADANGDALTYSWEQIDLGAAQALSAADNGTSPIFRAFAPASVNTRTFPRYADVLDGSLSIGEKYPAVARILKTRINVRDNRSGGGGMIEDNVNVTINGTAGPFSITAPNTAVTWAAGTQTVTWNVAGTTASPVSTANVRIRLSTDGGNSFPYTLADPTPNDGSQTVTIPDVNSTASRIRIDAVGNIYFDVSNVNFSTVGTPPPATPTAVAASPSSICTAGSLVSLSGTVGSGETIDWYTASCGGTLIGSGSPLSVTPAASTTYFARARRTASGVVSTACAATTVTLVTGSIAPPTNVAAADSTSCIQVNVTWTAAPAATGYQIFRNTTNNSATSSQIGTDTATPFADTTATPGTQYYYWLKSVSACGPSATFSTGDAGALRTVPTPPTALTATDGTSCTAVTLSWSPATNFTGYSIFRNTTTDFAAAAVIASSGTTSYSDTPTPGVQFYYWVVATNSCGGSTPLGPEAGFVGVTPFAPTSLNASDSSSCNEVLISWSAASNATSYQVWRATSDSSGAASLLGTPSTTTFTDTLVSPGTTNFYFIKAVSSCGTSAFSLSNSGRRAALPASPSSVSATDSDCAQVQVTFSTPIDSNQFAIYRNTTNSSAGSLFLGNVNVSPFNDPTAAPGTDYFYFVKASGPCGESGFSTGDAGRRDALPAAPGPVTASDNASCTTINLSWSSVPGATSYTLLRATTNQLANASAIFTGLIGTSILDGTPQQDVTYYYWVVATGPCGDSPAAGPDSGTIAPTPPAPANLAASDGTACFAVSLTWSPSAGANGYALFRNIVNSFAGADLLGTTTNLAFNDSTAAQATPYYYFVRALSDLCGPSGISTSDLGLAGASSSFSSQPADLTVNEGDPATFTAQATGDAPAYRWHKENVPLANDPPRITGADTTALTIDPAQIADAGSYSLQALTICGSLFSNAAALTVNSSFPCPADYNQDGGVDGGDVEAFFSDWSAAEPAADVNQDGGVDGADVEVFFNAWSAGGC